MKAVIRALSIIMFATTAASIWAGATEDFLKEASRGSRDWQKLESYLQKGANINAKQFGVTILMAAAGGGDLDMVKYLVKKGASLNLTDSSGRTALKHAELTGQQAVVSYLKSMGAH